MELQQLRYFFVSANLQHITKAAQELNIAQPALTQSIKRLEAELGVKLFTKKGRGIELTEAGKVLKKEAYQILRRLDQIPQCVQKAAELDSRTIRIDMQAASVMMTRAVIEYKKSHPDVLFKMMRNNEQEDCDFSVLTDFYFSKKDEIDFSITEDVLIAVLKESELSALNSIDLKQLRGRDFITLNSSKKFRKLCDSFCEKAGIALTASVEVDSADELLEMINAHMGICFWPQFSWGKVPSEEICLIPITENFQRVIGIRKNSANSALHDDFLRYLEDYFCRCRNEVKASNHEESA